MLVHRSHECARSRPGRRNTRVGTARRSYHRSRSCPEDIHKPLISPGREGPARCDWIVPFRKHLLLRGLVAKTNPKLL